MSILREIANRFRLVLSRLVDDPEEFLAMIRRSQDPRFGDYQANFAMPLGKRLKRKPQDVAAEIAQQVELKDLCQTPEVAGPGFINLRIRDDRLIGRLAEAVSDSRLGVPTVEKPRTYVVDFSSPNVAKPMHVGHIRSTVIGDSLCRTLRFLGHKAISDNHVGDWGTQFGMIIHGYKHLLNSDAYRENPVQELARLYRLVRQLVRYHEGQAEREPAARKIAEQEAALTAEKEAIHKEGKPDKKAGKRLRRQEAKLGEARQKLNKLEAELAAVDASGVLSELASKHPLIGAAVLAETAKLHAGDQQNLRLWQEFMPVCVEELDRMYRRMDVTFDHTLGESFYNDRLQSMVQDLARRGIARESDGAMCVFLEGHDVPMLVRKKDGAFLYATTDLATLEYRMETWNPDAILYVVGHPQSLHFKQLFAAAQLAGHEDVELVHVGFGSVTDEEGRPFKTREGDAVGLEWLIDEAVRHAARVVNENDDAKRDGPELSAEERACVAETVGVGALKYADLSHNRESDYVFSYEKMVATNGDTGTYMQYAYARVRNIFAKGGVDVEALRESQAAITLDSPAERQLGLELLRFQEALELTVADYRPNLLTSYLFDLANHFSTFYESCPVLKAESDELRTSRLLLCDLTARTIRQGLELLGIDVLDKM